MYFVSYRRSSFAHPLSWNSRSELASFSGVENDGHWLDKQTLCVRGAHGHELKTVRKHGIKMVQQLRFCEGLSLVTPFCWSQRRPYPGLRWMLLAMSLLDAPSIPPSWIPSRACGSSVVVAAYLWVARPDVEPQLGMFCGLHGSAEVMMNCTTCTSRHHMSHDLRCLDWDGGDVFDTYTLTLVHKYPCVPYKQ